MLPIPQFTATDRIKQNDNYSIILVPLAELKTVWNFLSTELDKDTTLWDLGNTKESIKTLLELEVLKLWLVIEHDGRVRMSFLTEYAVNPNGKKQLVVVWGMGEQMTTWLPLVLEALREHARTLGFDYVLIDGRDGWRSVLGKFGYKHLQSRFIHQVSFVGERVH